MAVGKASRSLSRAAAKGNSVSASPPAISSPRKHGELKGDLQICPDAAVSAQITPPTSLRPLLCSDPPRGFHASTETRTSTSTSPPAASSASKSHREARYRFTLCSDSACSTIHRPLLSSLLFSFLLFIFFISSSGSRCSCRCCSHHRDEGFSDIHHSTRVIQT